MSCCSPRAWPPSGARSLSQAGYLPSLGESVWDSSKLVPDQSALGNLLHALAGYTARPEGIQILSFALAFATIGTLMLTVKGHAPNKNGAPREAERRS